MFDGANSWAGNPRDFNWDALEDALLLAHNAAFERAIVGRLVEDGIAPVRMLQNQWQCTANMTSYLCGNRALAKALAVLEGQPMSKDIRDWMSGKTWQDAVDAGKADELARYGVGDVRECHGLWTKYSPRWPSHERGLSELTMRQCARGVSIDAELLHEYITVLQEVIFNLEKSLPWTDRGAAPTSPKAIAEQCRVVGIPAPPVKSHFDDGEEQFEAWEIAYGPQFPWVLGVSQYRQLNKLLSSLQTIRERLRPDNTIDFSLLYFGAHTGRWSGGGSGLNMQNLRKVPLYLKDRNLVSPPGSLSVKDAKDWVANCTDYAMDIRRLFRARPGKKFILADLSQIEPRVLAWLTGNFQLLEMLRTGMSIYEAFARVSMGWTGGNLKKENPDLYALAKIQVLGLGYGCGWEKFVAIAASYGVLLTPEKSQELVTSFRAQNPLTTGLWRTLDDAFKQSIHSDFEMALPSGRTMTYRGVSRVVRSKKDKETGKWRADWAFTALVGDKRKTLYGGLLTENLVQATARDVFGQHLLALEDQVGDVIFHVHDEAITEVDQDVTVKDVEHVMSRTPDWLEGCPVSCEAQEAAHYLK
ncbi:MAG TPA: DNA polymerase [Verrucomicrobiae bacterium]|nr:DNA polymerase [Verrucomicrobiae bacterium]